MEKWNKEIWVKLTVAEARADERQKCIEELNGIDGKTEDEMVMFMGYYKEQAISKFSEKVD